MIHVLIVTAVVSAMTVGTIYLWCLLRTWCTARRASCDPGDAQEVIVPGKRLHDGRPDRDFRWRLRQALRLMRRHSGLRVTLAGGGDRAGETSESEAGRQWLLARARDVAGRLRVEESSRDTIENLREVRRLLPAGGTRVALLSNRYHLARCAMLAGSLGMDVRICAAEPVLRLDRATARRLLLEAGYRTLFVVGRAWARLIGSERMLSRVQ